MRAPALAVLTALLAILLLGSAADAPAAITLGDGSVVAGTDWSSTTAQVAGAPGCRGTSGPACLPLADAAGTSGAPEDDLAAALANLARATTDGEAGGARATALAILEGDPQPGRATAYAGIPLLNWNAPAKVRTVP